AGSTSCSVTGRSSSSRAPSPATLGGASGPATAVRSSAPTRTDGGEVTPARPVRDNGSRPDRVKKDRDCAGGARHPDGVAAWRIRGGGGASGLVGERGGGA